MRKYILKKTLVISILLIFISSSLVSAMNLKSKDKIFKREISQLGINDGLIGYWSFDYETAEDESDNDNFGVIYGATAVDGISGRAYHFDGINDYIDILDSSDYKFSNQDITFSAWVQLADNSNHYHTIMSLADETTQYGYPKINLGKSRSGNEEGRIYFQLQTSYEEHIMVCSIKDGNTLPKFEWIYLTGVIDFPDTLKLYINAELQGIISLIDFDMSDAPSLKLNIGSCPYPGYNWEYGYHCGFIDEVRIYDRALSDEEIKELYENPGCLKKTIMFGRLSNLNTNVGNLMTFDAVRIRCIQFSPFKFTKYKSGEKIKISEDYKGIINSNIVFGIFQSNI